MTGIQTAPLPVETAETDGNPFKGLVPYQENEPLFARDADVDLIQSRLWAASFTVLFAGSGVGKTSFLNAKLIPALRNIFGASNVLVPRGWARVAPDEAIGVAINTLRAASVRSPKGGILILDQFEEVFQHFPNPDLLKRLGSVLAAFANDPESNLRILLSIREEFLAELTVFDNFIPGLLTNYYRLNKLTPQQAEVIVRKTAKLAGVEVSSNVKDLINDLQSIKEGSSGQPLTFVDPPYLQIVCHRIWCREKPTAAGNAMFLATYKPGEGRIELDQYCRDKLKKLSKREKVLVRKALGYLTGPHEAKKYARLPELEQEFGLRKGSPLGDALTSLSEETVRILRTWEEFGPALDCEKPGQPVQVFELYHDMYAPMLWKWRGEQERKEYRTALFKIAVVAVLSFFLVLLPIWAFSPVHNHLSNPTYGNADEMGNVLELRNVLSHTIIERPLGDHVWRDYNHKLFTLAALRSDSDAALDYRLAELSVQGKPAGDGFDQALGAAKYLLKTCRVGDASDAALIDQGGSSAIVAGAAGGIVTCLPEGDVKSVSLDISFKGDRGNEPHIGDTIRILGFSPTGKELVAAWVDGSKIEVAVFSTDTGKKLTPTQGDAVLQILPTDLRIHFSPNFIGLPPPAQTAAVFGSAPPSSAQEEVDNKNAGLASVIQDMKVAFGPNGLIGLVAGTQKTLFLYDTNKDNKVIRRTKFTDIDEVEFAQNGTFVLAVRQKNSLFPDQKIQFGRIAGNEAQTLPSPPATLPVGSRLIFNAGQAVLAQAGSSWGWVSSMPSSAPGGGQNKGFVPIPDFVPPGFPQALNENQDILLCKDGSGKLIFSHLKRSSIPLRIPFGGSQARMSLSTSPRRLTSSSVARFVTSGEFLSLDTNGSVVRKWKVPASVPDTIATVKAGHPEYTCKKGRQCSGNKEWGADFSDGELRIEGAQPWKWESASKKSPEAITLSSEGDRVLLWFPNEIMFVQKPSQQNAAVTIHRLPREKAIDGVFGPGKNRLTLLSTDSVAIFRLDLLQTDSNKAEAPKPEWRAAARGLSLFKENGDERGVVLYSGDWIHRFTESHTAWPNVVSVLLDVPVVDPLSPVVFLPGWNRRYSLRSEDLRNNSVVLIEGTSRRIDFEAEAKRFGDMGGSIYPLQWIATWDLSPCRNTEMQNKAAPQNQSDAKVADAEVPANMRANNAKIRPVTDPIPGSWRELKCSWEHRTGRRTESD